MASATSISWNGEYFVLTAGSDVCGNVFVYAYSSDGSNWTKTPFPSNIVAHTPYSTKYLGDNYAIVGNVQSSVTNSNGIVAVLDETHPVAITNNLQSGTIVYDLERNAEQPNRIVFPRSVSLALGDSSNVAFSLDQGNTWTASSNASSVISSSVKDAAWNGSYWVAVGTGANNTIATSPDGNVWTGRGKYAFSTSCNGIDWCPQTNAFVAVGSGTNVVATSKDGIYWLGTNKTLFSAGNDIKWNGKIWVAVGVPSGGNGSIAYSYDALTWNYASQSFNTYGSRVYYDGTVWYAFGQDTNYNLAISDDGISWVFKYSSPASKLMMNLSTGLFPDPSLNLYPEVPYPLRSVDHSIIANPSKYTYNHSDRGCAHIQPLSIACGEGATTIAYSIDGIQWTAVPNSIFTRCNKAIWTGVLWVAVGTGPNSWSATSQDGINWTASNNSSLMTECYDVAWNGQWLVAVGQGSTKIARSADGKTWTAISDSVFSSKVTAIEWTGVAWLAYGSGSNTTGVSVSVDASSWSQTALPNLCVTDGTNILTGNIRGYSSSSNQIGSDVDSLFDDSFYSTMTQWKSDVNNYTSGTGVYSGSTTTTYNTNLQVSGEWAEISLDTAALCRNYYVVLAVDSSNSLPKSWKLLGSNNDTTWDLLDEFAFSASIPPNNEWKYPFVCLPLSLPSNATAYSYYRLVVSSTFGAEYASVAELVLFGESTKTIDRYIRPILLKDRVLHPTRILSVDGALTQICRITDLCGNLIRDGVVNGLYTNNVLYGLSDESTSSAFDGSTHVTGSKSGEVSYISNVASLTNTNMDNSMNGVLLQSGITGSIHAACYNRKFLLLGGAGGSITYGALNTNVAPVFHSTNASSLFTTVHGLASNSGYGFVVPPNTIYLQEDDRLSLITPKYYDGALSPDTSISFNVYKSA